MKDNFIISFIFLLMMILASRVIAEKANKYLDQKQKADLVSLFSNDRTYTLVLVVVIIIFFFALLKYSVWDTKTSFLIYMGLVLILIVRAAYRTHHKLKNNSFPEQYIRLYLLSSLLRLLGIIIFFAVTILYGVDL